MEKLLYPAPSKLWAISFLVLISVLIENCSAQQDAYHSKPVPAKYLPSATDLQNFRRQADSAKVGAYDLTNSLPQGYVTDGSADYTTYLQDGIKKNPKVIFPNFPVLISSKGLTLISNSTVIFPQKSKIIMMPNDAPNYAILGLTNLQNVAIYNPVIQGDRVNHIGAKGEWGMGIWIAGCNNIQIIHPIVSKCWGDGIYVGKSNAPSRNIKIYCPQLDSNRRNGISIVSVDGMLIDGGIISNTDGTLPMSGVDIEPNNNDDDANNIDIENLVTFNNPRHGIFISLDFFVGAKAKNTNIKINNHTDDGSKYALGFHNLKNPTVKEPFVGTINVTNSKWKNNNDGFVHYNSYKNGIQFNFTNNIMVKKNSNGTTVTTRPDLISTQKTMQQ